MTSSSSRMGCPGTPTSPYAPLHPIRTARFWMLPPKNLGCSRVQPEYTPCVPFSNHGVLVTGTARLAGVFRRMQQVTILSSLLLLLLWLLLWLLLLLLLVLIYVPYYNNNDNDDNDDTNNENDNSNNNNNNNNTNDNKLLFRGQVAPEWALAPWFSWGAAPAKTYIWHMIYIYIYVYKWHTCIYIYIYIYIKTQYQ